VSQEISMAGKGGLELNESKARINMPNTGSNVRCQVICGLLNRAETVTRGLQAVPASTL
jgi:hypothetical protein